MLRDNDMINVFDVERVLGDLPIDIIKENIKSQINDPLSFMSNQCEQVYDTFDEAMNEFGHIDEYKNEITELKDDFSTFLINEVNNKFDLGIDLDNLEDYEVHEIAKNCYEFFIINLNDVITRFILNYIYANKSMISKSFNEEYKRKDVTTTNMKKLTKNKDDVIILSNIWGIDGLLHAGPASDTLAFLTTMSFVIYEYHKHYKGLLNKKETECIEA